MSKNIIFVVRDLYSDEAIYESSSWDECVDWQMNNNRIDSSFIEEVTLWD